MESGKKPSAVSDVGAWAMNVISSVGIIMANKQLMSSSGYAFGFATTLTGFHFTVTAFVGLVSNATGLSASKYVPMWELLWFSVVANTSIAGMNFSLMLNSVGFYQISKLSMIPVVCVMEWIINNKHYSRKVKMSVVVVVIGVGVCTVTDVKVNAKGFLCACLAVFSTSLQQITIGSLQKKYSIGSFELLSKTAPIQALSLLVLGPFVDYYLNGEFVTNYKMSMGAIETEELTIPKEKEVAVARFQRLLIVAGAATAERSAALELGNLEEANLLLGEAEAANQEAKKLKPICNFREEEFENLPKHFISMELVTNFGKKQLAELAASVHVSSA
ncbi:UDP-rhamnose/UDP-galactose transporter 2-like isoform X2 [Mangifera indica]|uniref:UDP-rhamnose/UDP-galactose transporter 2-like isoform X2 n=1 Tax=Mangifera indica TaxID=29780 RepID=UPI001CF97ACE|nr:UDP-rhamnose/UDP-galactose transporter 2-like isoform X2 [Mangifera indica]